MRLTVQVIIEADDDGDNNEQLPVVHEVAHIERGELAVGTLGLGRTAACAGHRPATRA